MPDDMVLRNSSMLESLYFLCFLSALQKLSEGTGEFGPVLYSEMCEARASVYYFIWKHMVDTPIYPSDITQNIHAHAWRWWYGMINPAHDMTGGRLGYSDTCNINTYCYRCTMVD